MKATNIKWVTDGADVNLPTEVEIPTNIESDEEIADFLSDEYGFLVEGFSRTMNVKNETLQIARNLMEKDPSLKDWVISKFPELKESKDEQKLAEWSEEDENMLENTIGLIEVLDRETKGEYTTKEYINFLKALKERYTWKPSDEHIQALDEVYKTHSANNVCRRVLFNLMNDLKKLRV